MPQSQEGPCRRYVMLLCCVFIFSPMYCRTTAGVGCMGWRVNMRSCVWACPSRFSHREPGFGWPTRHIRRSQRVSSVIAPSSSINVWKLYAALLTFIAGCIQLDSYSAWWEHWVWAGPCYSVRRLPSLSVRFKVNALCCRASLLYGQYHIILISDWFTVVRMCANYLFMDI